jgi:hypothetical protein
VNPDDRQADDELQVDPVALGRRRSLGPASLVVAVSFAFIALSVLKPWDVGRAAVPAASTLASDPTVTASSPNVATSPIAAVTATPGLGGDPFANPATPADLIARSSIREAWGVRAIVVPANLHPAGDGTGSGLSERWQAIDVGSDAELDLANAGTAVETGDDVVALGVTTPNDALPLDIRFWRLEAGDAVQRILPRPVPGREAGSWLWLPDPREATVRGTWPAGTYRIDVLVGPRIVRLATNVPAGVPALPRSAAVVAEPINLVDQLRSFAPGPFAFTPQVAIPIDVAPHDPLDERTAWLGPASGQLESAALGRVTVDRVTALGLLLNPGEQFVSADLERAVPVEDRPDVQRSLLPPVPRSDGELATAVFFEYGDLRPLESGLYHLTETVLLASGDDQTQTWNIEIVPSAAQPLPGVPLVRMARWVTLMSDLDMLAGEPLVSDHDLSSGAAVGTCGGSAHVGVGDGLFGLIEPPGTIVQGVRMYPTDAVRFADLKIRTALNAVDGLSIVAVPSGVLKNDTYEIIVDRLSAAGPDRALYTVCVS